jgi:hypothetical protein
MQNEGCNQREGERRNRTGMAFSNRRKTLYQLRKEYFVCLPEALNEALFKAPLMQNIP